MSRIEKIVRDTPEIKIKIVAAGWWFPTVHVVYEAWRKTSSDEFWQLVPKSEMFKIVSHGQYLKLGKQIIDSFDFETV